MPLPQAYYTTEPDPTLAEKIEHHLKFYNMNRSPSVPDNTELQSTLNLILELLLLAQPWQKAIRPLEAGTKP